MQHINHESEAFLIIKTTKLREKTIDAGIKEAKQTKIFGSIYLSAATEACSVRTLGGSVSNSAVWALRLVSSMASILSEATLRSIQGQASKYSLILRRSSSGLKK